MPAEALSPGRRALVALSAALATRDEARVRAAMEDAFEVADAVGVEEALLQSHLFLGFPDALNALSLWREVSGIAASPSLGETPGVWGPRGADVCARVYGGNYPRLRENVAELHPDVDDWMATGGYGRVIGRPGLDLATRELCIAALLAVWNVPRQLHSHLRGAVNAGASVAEIDEAVAIACGMIRSARKEEVRWMWRGIRAKTFQKADG